jgi:hypothetical protein
MKHRVVKLPSIWTDKFHYYPEERPWWFPFWFRFRDSYDNQICFTKEQDALDFIEGIKASYKK